MLRGLTSRLKRWTGQTLSPWVRHRLQKNSAPESSVGVGRFPLAGRAFQGLVKRRQAGVGRRPAQMAARLAGDIVHRHQILRPATKGSASPAPAQARLATSELVLAGGSPALPQPGQSGAQLQQLPPLMPGPGGFSVEQIIPAVPMPPTGSGFSVGQRIPPMAPSESGFSVGQRIPPMPKIAPKKETPARQKSRAEAKAVEPQKPAKKRIFSRVEEVLPPQSAAAAPVVKPTVTRPEPAEAKPALPELDQPLPAPADEAATPEPAVQPDLPERPSSAPAETAAGPEPSREMTSVPPPAGPPTVQRQVARPEREVPEIKPVAGPQPPTISQTGQPAAPEALSQLPMPAPTTRQPETKVEAKAEAEVTSTPLLSTSEREEPVQTHPAGPQLLTPAETKQHPPTPAVVARPEPAAPIQQSQPAEIPVEPESTAEQPVRRQIAVPERAEPAAPEPTGPQPLPASHTSRRRGPAALSQPRRAEPPVVDQQPEPSLETEPRVESSEPVQPAGPEPGPSESEQPAGPQALKPAETPRPAGPEALPRLQVAKPQPEGHQPASNFETEAGSKDLAQRPGVVPDRKEPIKSQPTGPRSLTVSETGQPAAPELIASPSAGQPPEQSVLIETETAAVQPKNDLIRLASEGSQPVRREPAAPESVGSPPKSKMSAPAIEPVAPPPTLAQPTGEGQAIPEAKPAPAEAGPVGPQATSPMLEQVLHRRAVARAKLPLHRAEPPVGPKAIRRQMGAAQQGVQRIFRSPQSRGSVWPQPLAGQPALPHQLPVGVGLEHQSIRPQLIESTASPVPTSPADGPEVSDPHLAALQAIQRKFGPAAMAPAQQRLAGLAGLGQPKAEPAPARPGPEPVSKQSERPVAPSPFDLDSISLGKPKVKVVRRQPPKKKELAPLKKGQKPAATKISQDRPNLVLARKPERGGAQAAPQPSRKKAKSAAKEAAPASETAQPDLSRLALMVYPLVKRLMAMERERRPGY